MRFGVISDLHIDEKQRYRTMIIEELKNIVREKGISHLIIAGDISSGNLKALETFFKLLRTHIPAQLLFVPGNHDVWVQPSRAQGLENLPLENKRVTSSWEKYNRILPLICAENEVHYLPNTPVLSNTTLILGNMGWYDYSFRNPLFNFSLKDYERKTYQGMYWSDLHFALWFKESKEKNSDIEVTEELLQKLKKDYEKGIQLAKSRNVVITKIVFVLHHIPFNELVIFKNKAEWDYFSAFMGSEKFGKFIVSIKEQEQEMLISNSNPSLEILVYCGHTHFVKSASVQTKNGTIFARTVPLGYTSELLISTHNPKETITQILLERIRKSISIFDT